MSLTPQWLDELRSRVSLSQLIGRTVRVQKAGREFKACCPFHNEKSPSFTINDDKGFYHCFGCGAHGDAIRWMTDHQGLGFMDAVKDLAVLAGMDMPAPDPRAAQRAEAAKTLHDTTAAAQDFFARNLAGDAGGAARAYLATRGFPAAIIAEFGFGFAPDSRGALKSALASFGDAQLVEAGLLIAVEEREPYDRFRGRLMLPIHDARGRVIAFGGRILTSEKTDAPKYLNSPDTPLFDKGRTLYNLHRAAPPARKSGRMVVVEGYMDVVALAAAGIVEAVAPLGTALTEDQIERLWQVVPCPVLCFDGDAAGQRAARRAIMRALPLLKPGHSLSIVTLPAGMDPDDVIRRDGPPAMEALLQGGASLIETLWQVERDSAPLATPEDKAGLKARLIDATETIGNSDIRALYRRDLLDRFGALAYPARERPPFQRQAMPPRGGRKGKDGRWQPPEQPLAPEYLTQMRKVGQIDQTLRPLLAAALLGLIADPRLIARHAEHLAQIGDSDLTAGGLIEGLLESITESITESGDSGDSQASDHDASAAAADDERTRALESAKLVTRLQQRGLVLPGPDDLAGMPYDFIARGDPVGMIDAIELLVEYPLVELALAQANAHTQHDLTEQSFAEQQRLVQRRLALRARLGQMGRARAAL
ncbi:DNA primase [Novosphingobium sp.]|uniref:DNA primase n=1 Tax=Novosphingobium sp. TaxID=1874826 RepID=UPI00334103F2